MMASKYLTLGIDHARAHDDTRTNQPVAPNGKGNLYSNCNYQLYFTSALELIPIPANNPGS